MSDTTIRRVRDTELQTDAMSAPTTQPGSESASLRIVVCADPPGNIPLQTAAARLSVDLNLPFVDKPRKRGVDVLLVVTEKRLELRMIGGDPITRGGRPLYTDLGKVDVHSAMGQRIRQPIGKAIGLKRLSDPRPTIIDCTAGWGEDSWLLAGLGCRVLAVERNKIIATLLRDGLLRAMSEQHTVASRITLVQTNAIDLLRRLQHSHDARQWLTEHRESLPATMADLLEPDVIYLDPMFPPRRKGAEGKPLKVLRQLVGDDTDADKLLHHARRVARRRVVVKRPLHGEPVGDDPPTTSHKGKSVRYDVYAMV